MQTKIYAEIQTKIQKYMNTCGNTNENTENTCEPCIFVRLLGWVGWGCDARKLEMGVGHLYVPKFV